LKDYSLDLIEFVLMRLFLLASVQIQSNQDTKIFLRILLLIYKNI